MSDTVIYVRDAKVGATYFTIHSTAVPGVSTAIFGWSYQN